MAGLLFGRPPDRRSLDRAAHKVAPAGRGDALPPLRICVFAARVGSEAPPILIPSRPVTCASASPAVPAQSRYQPALQSRRSPG